MWCNMCMHMYMVHVGMELALSCMEELHVVDYVMCMYVHVGHEEM